jgi:ParB/Sulfiredoxin domain
MNNEKSLPATNGTGKAHKPRVFPQRRAKAYTHTNNGGTVIMTMNPKDIRKHETFSNLFPVNEELAKKIEEDMRLNRYDFSQPIIMATWDGQEEPVCIDGHTRRHAAIQAGIEAVPVFTHEFDTEDEAVDKAILLQSNRRNMIDAEIVCCIEILDKRRKRGGDRRSKEAKSTPQDCGKESSRSASAKETAAKLGISSRKVEQTRTVMDHGGEQTVDAIKNKGMSINRAYNETQAKRKKEKSRDKDDQPRQAIDEKGMETTELPSVSDSPSSDIETMEDTLVRLKATQYAELTELGGSIEDHVSRAIDRYLWMMHQDPETL